MRERSKSHVWWMYFLLLPTWGCTSNHPLGPGWETLPKAEAREERVVSLLSELISTKQNATGGTISDRELIEIDLEGVSYQTEHGPAELRWLDVEEVESFQHADLPARPVTLLLVLRRDSPSTKTALDQIKQPLLTDAGLVRSHVRLDRRPPGSRTQFLRAIDYLTRRPVGAVPKEAPAPSQASRPTERQPAEPVTSEQARKKLQELKAMHAEGLITDEEYAAERKEILDRW